MLEIIPGERADRIALVGPTASGKTAVGIELARRLGAEIVSADSMQVYRQMDIGSAKPSIKEQSEAVFHGIDVVNPDEEWTLADYQRLGDAVCNDIAGRGPVPLIVGGTGLYVRALTTLLDIPVAPPNEEFRAHWREFAEANGHAALLAEVGKIDPDTAARLHVNDIGRQIRALEVWAATGRTLTDLHRENKAKQSVEPPPLLFGLNYADRERLYHRIDTRVDQMLADGFADEVRGLLERGYAATLKPMQSLGYKQLCAYHAGELTLAEAAAMIQQETRRFAKRQIIWFRGDPRVHWLHADGKSATQLAEEVHVLISTHRGQQNRYEQTAA